jgi:serine/threonine protein phosphatase PrpC
MFKLVAGSTSHSGLQKQSRGSFAFVEPDDLAFAVHAGSLAIVADGLGEPEAAEVSGRTAVAAFQIAYGRKSSKETIPDALRRSLHEANVAVLAATAQMGGRSNAGTTLAAAVIHGKLLYWICVGDTRLYLLRDGVLAQVNADHVARSAPCVGSCLGKNYVGQAQTAQADAAVRGYPLREEDVVLLCSAGVYREMGEAEIAAAFLHGSPASGCETVRAWTLERERVRPEDLTLVAIRCQWAMPLAPVLATRSTQQLGRILVAIICVAILITSWMAANAVSDYWMAARSQQPQRTKPAVLAAPAHPLLPKPSAAKRVSEPVEKPSLDSPSRPVEQPSEQHLDDND